MKDEAPEFATRCICGIPSHTGLCEHLERCVDPPAALGCPTCGSVNRDFRNLGCNGSYGVLHDNCGTDLCPDAWHIAPAAPDERDKALEDRLWEALKTHSCKKPDEAKLIVFLSEKKFREAVGPVLATVRAQEREATFTAIGVELRRYGSNIRKVDLLARFQELYRELESARTGKVE